MAYCRICKNSLIRIIKFRNISLVGKFFKKKILKKYKISLNFCKICKHVQISEILNPDLLFKNYLWETGVSKTNINLIKIFINKLSKSKINKNSKILEIASNDGSLLDFVKKKFKCFVIGIDPAKNLIKNRKRNFTTIVDYFDYNKSIKIKKKFENFDFIIARNVVAHVKNPNEIFKGVENILKQKGQFVLEVPHLYNIFKFNQYDNIFHEHIGFHSLKSIIELSERNNLKVFNVEKIDSQGGSIRCYICKKNNPLKVSQKIKLILREETQLGLYSSSQLKSFKNKIISHISDMQSLIKKLKI